MFSVLENKTGDFRAYLIIIVFKMYLNIGCIGRLNFAIMFVFNTLTVEKMELWSFRIFSSYSINTTNISDSTKGSSAGAGSGKGHVKSASVSSPGPSVADNSTPSTQQSDSLGARYTSHSLKKPHILNIRIDQIV